MSEIQQEKLVTIRLGGQLGKLFGKTHRFYISSPAEAVQALSSQIDGFYQYLNDPERKTLYKVFVGRGQIDPESQLHELSGSKDIRIAPVPAGAKNGGLFQAVLGVALIGLSFVPGMNVALWSGVTAKGLVLSMGMSLMLGGLAQMLSPQPKLSVSEPTTNVPNTSLNGVQNTTAQGRPAPLIYGEVMAGSAVISAGLVASDLN